MVFALLEDGSRWAQWAGPFVPRSRWQTPGSPPGTVGAVRRLGLWPFLSLERIVEHVPDARLSYVVDSWAPYRDYRADVDLHATVDGGTQITWRATFTPKLAGTGPLLRVCLGAIVKGFAKNVARAAERRR